MGKSAKLLTDKLKELIENKQITKAEILRRAKMSATLLDSYLNGKSVPGLNAADRLAQAVGTDLGSILGGTTVAESALSWAEQNAELLRKLQKSYETNLDLVRFLAERPEDLEMLKRPGIKEALRLLASLDDSKLERILLLLPGLSEIDEVDLSQELEKKSKL